jgi:hypothetical protein
MEPRWQYVSETTVWRKWPDGRQQSALVTSTEVQKWIAEGNTPDPIPEPTIEQIKATLETAIDQHIDQIAKYKRYGRAGISPSVACLGYASYLNPYQAEAIAYGQWIASIWPVVNQIMADVESGTRPIPTEQELISELPEMIWPELGE